MLAYFSQEPWPTLFQAVGAGLLASLACGLGVLPLMIRGIDPIKHRGLGYAMAAGLMFSASVYNLILPALEMKSSQWSLPVVVPILIGMFVGAAFLAMTERLMPAEADPETLGDVKPGETTEANPFSGWGGRLGLLVFLAMTIHSIPEGVAVGVGYTSDSHEMTAGLGPVLAIAIAIHNIPEGLAVAIPMRSNNVPYWKCIIAAIVTSLPQPIATIPAVLLAWFFEPLMPMLMGFAAGAMIFLVVMELIPEALHTENNRRTSWAFLVGFSLMLLVQVLL